MPDQSSELAEAERAVRTDLPRYLRQVGLPTDARWVDTVLAEFARRGSALTEAQAEIGRLREEAVNALVNQTQLKGMTVEEGAAVLDLGLPRELMIVFVDAARKMLGDAPNYSETRVDFPGVSLGVKAAGEAERYVLTVQRAGNLTPHEARQAAEAEVQRLSTECGELRDEAEQLRADAARALVRQTQLRGMAVEQGATLLDLRDAALHRAADLEEELVGARSEADRQRARAEKWTGIAADLDLDLHEARTGADRLRSEAAELRQVRADAVRGDLDRLAKIRELHAEVDRLRSEAPRVDLRMTRPAAPDWGGEEDDQGNPIYHHDPDFGLGSPMNVFWALGHGHDPDAFVRAVIDYSLEMYGGVPRIDDDDRPVEVWQETLDHGDAVEYRRTAERPTSAPRDRVQPVTALDLDRRTRGAPKCAVLHCREPWARGANIHAAVEPGDAEHMTVQVYLCRQHARRFPEPSYRVHMIPVGATILLPATTEPVGATDAES